MKLTFGLAPGRPLDQAPTTILPRKIYDGL